jgi:indole-3-glycerol phosphate synthase
MKDIVVSLSQIEAAARLGADSILLIYRVFRRGYADLGLRDAVLAAHGLGLEVLLEACGREELLECLSADVELLGVNARDLSTLVVDKRVHEEAVRDVDVGGRVLVAESGIETAADVRRLRRLGYKAFLVGTALMRAGNIESKVRELVRA